MTIIVDIVCACQTTVEVRKQVHCLALERAWVEDTIHSNTDIGLSVVANDGCVDDESKEGVLVCGSVVFQEGGGVVVADGDVFRSLGESGGCNGRENGCCAELHCE